MRDLCDESGRPPGRRSVCLRDPQHCQGGYCQGLLTMTRTQDGAIEKPCICRSWLSDRRVAPGCFSSVADQGAWFHASALTLEKVAPIYSIYNTIIVLIITNISLIVLLLVLLVGQCVVKSKQIGVHRRAGLTQSIASSCNCS